MTSLMDIVFIMLIFFIVTASFVHEKGLETNIQKPDVSRIDTVEKDQPLIFEIESANHVFVGNRLVDVASVGPLVKRELASMPDLKVVVRPAQASHTGMMIGVIDEAIQAGLPEEALIVVRKPY